METTKNIIDESINKLNSLNEKFKANPTIIYNEGWMVRILVAQSMETGITIISSDGKSLDFKCLQGKNWTSEAQIDSPFVGTRIKKERHTRPDIIIGDFDVNWKVGTDILRKSDAQILGIIEAKMNSSLDKGTTYAKEYNQASRNVCCLLHKNNNQCDTFFVVVAPENRIKKINFPTGGIKDIKKEIEARYVTSKLDIDKELTERIDSCNIFCISYEDWIKELEKAEVDITLLNEFYQSCLEHNNINNKKPSGFRKLLERQNIPSSSLK
ncbi:MAG: hypothetical protein LBM62_01540 [Mediterranea sp.]|jgi:hypothetical protein|nr:hypothetical protein [Mediterranea sp.]